MHKLVPSKYTNVIKLVSAMKNNIITKKIITKKEEEIINITNI